MSLIYKNFAGEIMIDLILDAKHLRCPEPIILLVRTLRNFPSGTIVELHARDVVFRPDVMAWIKMTKNKLLKFEQRPDYEVATIKKK